MEPAKSVLFRATHYNILKGRQNIEYNVFPGGRPLYPGVGDGGRTARRAANLKSQQSHLVVNSRQTCLDFTNGASSVTFTSAVMFTCWPIRPILGF